MDKEIYFDNSATTRPLDEVIEYMNKVYSVTYGNPSSLHRMGIEAEKLLKKAREAIAHSIGAETREIIFTSGGTEANNLAIRGYLEANPRSGKHILTTVIEHPSVLEVYKYLAEAGYSVDYLKVNSEGLVDLEDLKNKMRQDTALISIMLVNNEIGAIQPIDGIIRIKNSINRNSVLHVDAVQAYGKLKILPKKTGIDMMTFSSHKIHGPKGVGALFVDRSKRIKPIVFGGGQESLLRSGTENVPGICGFGLASEIIFSNLESNHKKVERLRQRFIDKLKDSPFQYKVVSPEGSLPYILNVSFSSLRSEVLLHHLEEKNIFVSTGSACSSRKNVHSHVLKALGMEACDIEGALRFSFSSGNNEDEVDFTINALNEIVPKIQIKKSR